MKKILLTGASALALGIAGIASAEPESPSFINTFGWDTSDGLAYEADNLTGSIFIEMDELAVLETDGVAESSLIVIDDETALAGLTLGEEVPTYGGFTEYLAMEVGSDSYGATGLPVPDALAADDTFVDPEAGLADFLMLSMSVGDSVDAVPEWLAVVATLASDQASPPTDAAEFHDLVLANFDPGVVQDATLGIMSAGSTQSSV